MVRLKRRLALGMIMLGLALLLWSLWPAAPFRPSVQLPEGVSLAEALRAGKNEPPKGWHTNIYCLERRPGHGLGARVRLQLIAEQIRYRIHEMLGQTLVRLPNPPTVDYLTPRLGECYQTSGEKYLLAKEFGWEVDRRPGQASDYTFLGFVWGGTNQLRHARDRIAVLENGMLRSGIFAMRLTWALPDQRGATTVQYLPGTNRCAVIRDVRGLVKIVPIEYLKAYADAGLVRLPNRE